MRVCSGHYDARHEDAPGAHRQGGPLANALTFMASDREIVETAYPGDVIGLHNHGTITIGDTFTEGEALASPASPTSRPNCSAAHACAIH